MSYRGLALAVAAAAMVSLAGCETTEQESAKIGQQLGDQRAGVTTTHIAAANRYVRVSESQLVRSSAGTAAAIELTNSSDSAQVDVPILITVDDATGKAVYTNATVGTTSPIGELALLPAHSTRWWVDADVLASGGSAASVTARIGAASSAAPAPAATLNARKLHTGSNYIGAFVGGSVVNGSAAAQADVTIYAVALIGTRVVAAGQSVVASLAGHASAPFQVSLIGSAKDASAAVTIAPAHIS
jgi:hypothetical protein